MTIFKIFRLDMSGTISVELVAAVNWQGVIIAEQWAGSGVMFKIEAVGTTDAITDLPSGEAHI